MRSTRILRRAVAIRRARPRIAAALALWAAAWRAALAPNVHAAAQSSEIVPTGIMLVARGGLGWTEGRISLPGVFLQAWALLMADRQATRGLLVHRLSAITTNYRAAGALDGPGLAFVAVWGTRCRAARRGSDLSSRAAPPRAPHAYSPARLTVIRYWNSHALLGGDHCARIPGATPRLSGRPWRAAQTSPAPSARCAS